MDQAAVAQRVAALGDVVAEAGINDVEQGAELLATSEDMALLGAVVGAISEEDLDRGLAVARVSGELQAVSSVVARVGMPVLAAFLVDRSYQLHEVAIDAIVRSGGTRAIARAIAETGARVGAMGEAEATEGVVRLAAAGALADRSDELEESGAALAFEGYQSMQAGEAVRQAGVAAAAAGVAEVAQGSEEIGSAGALADVAERLES